MVVCVGPLRVNRDKQLSSADWFIYSSSSSRSGDPGFKKLTATAGSPLREDDDSLLIILYFFFKAKYLLPPKPFFWRCGQFRNLRLLVFIIRKPIVIVFGLGFDPAFERGDVFNVKRGHAEFSVGIKAAVPVH